VRAFPPDTARALQATARRDPTVDAMPAARHRRVTGTVASALLVLALGTTPGTAARTTGDAAWKVAPGVRYREWQFHTAAGPQRIHVLDIDPTVAGVSLDYVTHHRLRTRTTTRRLLSRDSAAVAGVNGSFFDIEDTGAPLGIGRSSTRGLLHAAASGWNEAFYRATDGSYHIGPLTLSARVPGHPEVPVAGYNVPHARPNAVTVYTAAWGAAAGTRVVDDPDAEVREVHVREGVVRRNSRRPMDQRPFHGFLLLGVGTGAPLLKSLAVGSAVSARWSLDQHPQMAITGSQVLVQDGKVVATNDHMPAPRTAVGIDPSTGHILLAALDGRQTGAAGLSTLGWARVLAGLGVGAALNLDGGGSTTMVARDATGASTGVVNVPSQGHQRRLPDALAVDYAPPRG
jgi:hypothetical protein